MYMKPKENSNWETETEKEKEEKRGGMPPNASNKGDPVYSSKLKGRSVNIFLSLKKKRNWWWDPNAGVSQSSVGFVEE